MGNRAYYNEIDPYAAAWLRNLIKAGHIPNGDVDERSIADVQPMDIADYTQCHFFAGIGGWSLALRLAGWPDDRPVWTGSCPCQPFSVAGKGAGTADARHLWPEFHRLIRECRPPVVFGEQVASRAGREWLSGVLLDLEGVGYAGAGADLCAAGVGAPHIRQRLYWVAVDHALLGRHGNAQEQIRAGRLGAELSGGTDGDMANAARFTQREPHDDVRAISREDAWVSFGGGSGRYSPCNMADADDAGREGRAVHAERPDELSPWSRGVEWRRGADGKERRVKPGVRLLAHGVPARVGKLRAYGNAIVPPLAAEVIKAFMDA